MYVFRSICFLPSLLSPCMKVFVVSLNVLLPYWRSVKKSAFDYCFIRFFVRFKFLFLYLPRNVFSRSCPYNSFIRRWPSSFSSPGKIVDLNKPRGTSSETEKKADELEGGSMSRRFEEKELGIGKKVRSLKEMGRPGEEGKRQTNRQTDCLLTPPSAEQAEISAPLPITHPQGNYSSQVKSIPTFVFSWEHSCVRTCKVRYGDFFRL